MFAHKYVLMYIIQSVGFVEKLLFHLCEQDEFAEDGGNAINPSREFPVLVHHKVNVLKIVTFVFLYGIYKEKLKNEKLQK